MTWRSRLVPAVFRLKTPCIVRFLSKTQAKNLQTSWKPPTFSVCVCVCVCVSCIYSVVQRRLIETGCPQRNDTPPTAASEVSVPPENNLSQNNVCCVYIWSEADSWQAALLSHFVFWYGAQCLVTMNSAEQLYPTEWVLYLQTERQWLPRCFLQEC
jgi:hypothetical protein